MTPRITYACVACGRPLADLTPCPDCQSIDIEVTTPAGSRIVDYAQALACAMGISGLSAEQIPAFAIIDKETCVITQVSEEGQVTERTYRRAEKHPPRPRDPICAILDGADPAAVDAEWAAYEQSEVENFYQQKLSHPRRKPERPTLLTTPEERFGGRPGPNEG